MSERLLEAKHRFNSLVDQVDDDKAVEVLDGASDLMQEHLDGKDAPETKPDEAPTA